MIVYFLVAVGCDNPGEIIKPPQTIVTVKDKLVQFTCVLQGNLHNDFLPGSYWEIFLPSNEYIRIGGNDSHYPNFEIAFYQVAACNYVVQLTILSAPLQYNGTIVGCKQFYVGNHSSWEENGTLGKQKL